MTRFLAGGGSEEATRAYLQARLTMLYKIMFAAFVALIISQFVMYELVYPDVRPRYQSGVYILGVSGLLLLAVLWRGVLVRKTLAIGQLYALDIFFVVGSGVILAGVGLLAYDFPPAHYTALIYGSFVVFTRAIVVPSTARWTALVSTLSLAPMVVAAALLAIYVDVIAPGAMFFVLAVIFVSVAVLLATTGSRIIYGLRQQVSAAVHVGQYTLDRLIGEGGMGAVYRARHVMLRRPTAVKLLRADRIGVDTLEKFEREVQHMSELTHPNTVAVYDYGRSHDGVFYYAMEYLGGGIDLERLVHKHGPQPAGRVANILVQVCGALQEAHEKQIIHRDIKPANIMLCERGGMPDVAKVVDYGLVKELADTGTSQRIVGTPAYMAPEAVTEPDRVGPASDLYSLGAVGYFLVTGQRVFEAKTAVELCALHATATPKRPSEVSTTPIAPELEAILMRCLEKSPQARFATASDMADALRALPVEWTTRDARRWWREYREAQDASVLASSTPTMTVDVDLGPRRL